MQEIQDKTLENFRGFSLTDKRLAERSEIFPDEMKHIYNPDIAVGFRVTAMPLGREFPFDRVFDQGNILEGYDMPRHRVLQGEHNPIILEDIHPHYVPRQWKPKLRGARKQTHDSWPQKPQLNAYCEIYCDGLIETGFVSCLIPRLDQTESESFLLFNPDYPIVLFANALVWAHRVRTRAGFPLAEIAIDASILVKGLASEVRPERYRGYSHCNPRLQPGPIRFPRYSLGESDRIPYLINKFYYDFLNSMEKDASVMGELIIKGWDNN